MIVVGPVAALGAAVPTGPLGGRTVVLTRTGSRARGLVVALEAAGAGVVEVSLTEQVDPADGGAALRAAAADVRDHAWVVLTSVNAAERFAGALRDARDLGTARVAAVGPSTAAALRRAGIEADLVPSAHSAQGLVDAFPVAGGSASRRVLFPCADLAPGTVMAGLGAKGWEVRRVEAYRTVPRPAPSPGLVARVSDADALVLTAPSSLRALQEWRGPDGGPAPLPPHIVCIGPTTAAAAHRAGLPGVVEARDTSDEGMAATLVDVLGVGAADGS